MENSNEFVKLLPELTGHGVISDETANTIRQYFTSGNQEIAKKPILRLNWALIVLGLFGALLIGSGVILLIAHNWDSMSRGTRTVFSLLPMLAGQSLCFFAHRFKPGQRQWQEPCAVFLSLAVASSIALIGQTYHIHGDLGRFLFTWMLLTMPLIFLMPSSATALIYAAGILFWAGSARYENPFFQPLLVLLAIPPALWFSLVYRKNHTGVDSSLMGWICGLWLFPAVMISFGDIVPGLWTIAVPGTFSIIYLTGQILFNKDLSLKANGMKLLGYWGIVISMFSLSFRDSWRHVGWDEPIREYYRGFVSLPADFLIIILILCSASLLLFLALRNNHDLELLFSIAPSIAGVCFIISSLTQGYYLQVAVINCAFLAAGALKISQGVKSGRMSTLNNGMLMIMFLILARFFDTRLSFVIRGLAFIAMGIVFLSVNVYLGRKAARQ
ncbi:MAG: DUF2157 domain-containing protein [Candidatus Wallbacteria bacterium]|nr:DUF2157 domain-containing protein [Candidatus Wallbacteria bacterium]